MKNRINYPNLPQLFLEAREILLVSFRPILKEYGLTEQQWRILRVLDEHGELEQWEICEKCRILSSSMAGVLARMEETNLVARSRASEDQRRVFVRLGARGDALIDAIAPEVARRYRKIEKAAGKAVLRDVHKSLQAFVDASDAFALQEASDARSDDAGSSSPRQSAKKRVPNRAWKTLAK